MRLCLLLVALAGCRDLSRDPPIDAVPAGPHVKLATFNVRRFFDTVCDSGVCGNGAYEELPAPGEFEARADQIAMGIRTLDADVIALEEIETQACLDALLLRLADVMPYGVLGEIGEPASVDVAILSKTPIESVTTHRADSPLPLPNGSTTTFSRELLEVAVHTNDVKLIMFAAHFKAKSSDDPPRRLAEGQVAARLVTASAAREPDAIVVMGGDLNDTPDSPPLKALTDAGLVRLADDVSPAEQATYEYQGSGQAIDHLLMANGVRLPYSTDVFVDQHSNGFAGSDHRALTSQLLVPE